MALLHSTLLYISLPWLFFILVYSRLLYHMALVHSTLFYITPPLLYLTLLDSTLIYNGSTSLYYILHCLNFN